MHKMHRGLVGGCVAALLALEVAVAGPAVATTEEARALVGTASASSAAQAPATALRTTAYHQETYRGEYLRNYGHSCGGKLYKTDAVVWAPAGPMRQYAWIFRNCGKTSVKRRAIVRLDRDGPCYTIPAGRTRTLEVKLIATVIARNPYERSAAC